MPFARSPFARPIPLFVRLTLLVAAGLVALAVAAFVIKLVVAAAILVALVLGALFLFNFVNAFVRIRRSRITVQNREPIAR